MDQVRITGTHNRDLLTLDQIAALYGIHRATVAYTLAQARAERVESTRRELATPLGVAAASLDSVVRAAASLDSVVRVADSRIRLRPWRVARV